MLRVASVKRESRCTVTPPLRHLTEWLACGAVGPVVVQVQGSDG
jgi:hypothetical protein